MLPQRAGRGFTLIELMIVVAIIAILAAIAIPAYQDYLIRSQVSEGISLATGAKTAVWDFVANTGRYPHGNESAGLAQAGSINGSYASNLVVTDGLISVDFTGPKANANVQGGSILLSPITNAGSIIWKCGGRSMPSKYLPSFCRPA
ncbi:pilin [Pinirhizobacter sp.]|uniref:pilin n=1 Tax=Pinirhizobacter sp. TaxID=2950432 RepID=UPI002F415E08